MSSALDQLLRQSPVPSMEVGPFVPEVPMQLPEPSRLERLLARIGESGVRLPAPRYIPGRDSGANAALALLSGLLNAKSKRAASDMGARQDFYSGQQDEIAARKKARDDAFRSARTAAAGVRDARTKADERKREVLRKRADEMTRAINERMARAATAGDASSQANLLADAKRIQADLGRVLADPLMAGENGAGLPVGGLPAMTPRPARPAPIRGTVEAKKAAATLKPELPKDPADKLGATVRFLREKGMKTKAEVEEYFKDARSLKGLKDGGYTVQQVTAYFD